jgi:hypothetical protein
LFRHLDKVGHYDAAIRLHQLAAAEVEAEATGDQGPVNRLGIALIRKKNHQEAARRLRRTVELARERDDVNTLRSCLGNLGIVYERIGRYREVGVCPVGLRGARAGSGGPLRRGRAAAVMGRSAHPRHGSLPLSHP